MRERRRGLMLRLVSAEWFRISRFWLSWVLLGALVIAVPLQVNARIGRLQELDANLAQQSDRYEATWLRQSLRYPASIGYAVRLCADFGWFFLILLTAVVGAEDFSRRTLRSIIARGIGRARYLVARCLALWLTAGVGLLTVTLLAAAAGPYVHAQVTDDPISLTGLASASGAALFVAVRAWLACLPFIVATLFWAVLGRRAGPALGVGIGLHAFEFLNGFVLPIVALATAHSGGQEVPLIWRWQLRVFSITLGYNADVLLNWGSPFQRTSIIEALGAASTVELGAHTLLPTAPWRAVAFLAGYTVPFLGWAIWILHRRDLTYEI
jgi:ABC-type transport system involved in multi-copper enzyme maturation permease subunit